MNLHAATTVDGRDRKQLERICRYLLRPPFAHDAVTALPGGRVRVSFKAPWRSGTAHADMDAHQFLARLCPLLRRVRQSPSPARTPVAPLIALPFGDVFTLPRPAAADLALIPCA